jgi:putative transposase
LRRAGHSVSQNRVHRLWKRARLQVKRRVGKKRRLPGDPSADVLYSTRPGQVWSVDFIFDTLMSGAKLKMLTVGDDLPRECLVNAS